jgi:hypothetical protein
MKPRTWDKYITTHYSSLLHAHHVYGESDCDSILYNATYTSKLSIADQLTAAQFFVVGLIMFKFQPLESWGRSKSPLRMVRLHVPG